MWDDPGWAFGIAFIILAFSLRKALPSLLQSMADKKSDAAALPTESGASLEALEELRRRVSELEERADFAERLLSQEREERRLGPPGS